MIALLLILNAFAATSVSVRGHGTATSCAAWRAGCFTDYENAFKDMEKDAYSECLKRGFQAADLHIVTKNHCETKVYKGPTQNYSTTRCSGTFICKGEY
jgi:hypothetical protein